MVRNCMDGKLVWRMDCCFLPNLVRHLFDGDVLFKATNCTTGYNVAWWIATVGSCIGWLVDACFSFMKASAFVGSDKE